MSADGSLSVGRTNRRAEVSFCRRRHGGADIAFLCFDTRSVSLFNGAVAANEFLFALDHDLGAELAGAFLERDAGIACFVTAIAASVGAVFLGSLCFKVCGPIVVANPVFVVDLNFWIRVFAGDECPRDAVGSVGLIVEVDHLVAITARTSCDLAGRAIWIEGADFAAGGVIVEAFKDGASV